jgi:hypothetical protein
MTEPRTSTSPRLLVDDDREDLYRRWLAIEERFVDDPAAAVRDADGLITQAIDRIRATLDTRRAAMREQWDTTGNATTEQLRTLLNNYERLFGQLADAPAPDAWHQQPDQ